MGFFSDLEDWAFTMENDSVLFGDETSALDEWDFPGLKESWEDFMAAAIPHDGISELGANTRDNSCPPSLPAPRDTVNEVVAVEQVEALIDVDSPTSSASCDTPEHEDFVRKIESGPSVTHRRYPRQNVTEWSCKWCGSVSKTPSEAR